MEPWNGRAWEQHERQIGEFRQCQFVAICEPMRAGQGDVQLLFEKREAFEPFVLQVMPAEFADDGNVDICVQVRELLFRGKFSQLKGDIGDSRGQLPKQGSQELKSSGLDEPDGQAAENPLVDASSPREGELDVVQQAPGVVEKNRSSVGQCDMAGGSLDECDADGLFESLDATTDHGLSDVQPFGAASKVPFFCDSDEGRQQVGIDGRTHRSPIAQATQSSHIPIMHYKHETLPRKYWTAWTINRRLLCAGYGGLIALVTGEEAGSSELVRRQAVASALKLAIGM